MRLKVKAATHASDEHRRLARICSRLGGRLICVDLSEWCKITAGGTPGWYPAPFTARAGIDWPNKSIYYADYCSWTYIIHEMGHTFACRDDPADSNEAAFLGWEFVLARRFDFETWLVSMDDYGVSGMDESGVAFTMGELRRDRAQLTKFEKACIERSIANGCLDSRGRLRSVRKSV